jgi:hypothetical protein
MLEEEFGMREPPKTRTRFGAVAVFSSHALSKSLLISYSLSVALPPKLRILPPKRKNTTTQAPEPRRGSSFSKGPWETLWDCDLEAESPIEEDFHLGSFPDYHAEQGSEPDEDVATPVNGTSWTSDEELTPLFSSNFPTRSTDTNASMREGYSESSGSLCLNSPRA